MTVGQNPGDLFDSMQYWRHLSGQAEAGILEIPEDVAAQCDAACVTYIAHLEGMVQKTEFLVDVDAFGTLPSAQQLGRKFQRLAIGEERSAAVVIKQHIEVIELMRSVFRRYFDEAEYADQRTSTAITEIAESLGK